jgi:dipeptidyl aminopeptidase/acylaminoacyl peptidase
MAGSSGDRVLRLPRLALAAGVLLASAWAHSAAHQTSSGRPTGTPETADQSPQTKGKGKGQGKFGGGGPSGVYRDQVTPHWFHNGARFWYVNKLRDGAKEFIVVDAEAGTRKPAFDHTKLAAGLSKAAGTSYAADKLPFDEITFVDDEKAVSFRVGEKTWKCNLNGYEVSQSSSPATDAQLNVAARIEAIALADRRADETRFRDELARQESLFPDAVSSDIEQAARQAAAEAIEAQQRGQRGQAKGQATGQGKGQGRGFGQAGEPVVSPDGKWTASVRDNNVFVKTDGGTDIQLSKDGEVSNGYRYGSLHWSPDSKSLVAFRVQPGDNKEVHLIQSSPDGGGRAVLKSRPYDLPGDKLTSYELNLFDIESRKQSKPDVGVIDFGNPNPRLRWLPEGHTFRYEKRDRGHTRFRLIEVDALTGQFRDIIDEKAKTFITSPGYSIDKMDVRKLEKSDEYIYPTEKDGWKHLYLIDAKTAKETLMTPGEFVVRGISQVDEDKRQIWFTGCGRNPGQDPYLVHYYRVNFDGTGLTALTEGDGEHTITYSPDNKYIIDKYQRIDLPPVHELRRVSDGKLVCALENADISELTGAGWKPPEVFVTKGRDGKTDIWGFIARPRGFDPNKKYPVIETIYAGPQGYFSRRETFSSTPRFTNFTDLGFIAVQLDGMGTQGRSKAFHDVCWHNLGDAGFPDRVLWHKAVAAKYPHYDATRVGITGNSAGGQNSTGGMLFQPEFYKVAVSSCGCHDNRMDKASWNEQWMGYPVGPHYAEASNVDNAHKLQGKLLLIVGELDTNVPPESTFRVCDALIKAGKDFDLLVIPGGGHGLGGAYGSRRQQDYFVRHLLGVEPPNRNAPGQQGGEQ